jgi:peptide/nickel transport system substrate-binding protein
MKRRMMKGIVVLLVLVFSVASLGACSLIPSKTVEPTKITVAVADDPRTFTFLSAMGSESYGNIVSQIYEHLFDYGVDYQMTPELAETWDKVDDTHYTFNLRKGVKFSDGSDFKASDVIFSFNKSKDDPANSQAVAGIDFENTKVIDDNTISVAFTSPYVVNFINLSQVRIASEAAFNSSEDQLKTTTCGTGPYMLKEYKPGASALLVKNPNYWGDEPKIDEVVFNFITDASQRTNSLMSGEADIITTVGFSDLDEFKNDPDYAVTSKIGWQSANIFFNTTSNSVCRDVNLRQAVAYAVDKAGILKTVFNGYGEESVAPFTVNFRDYDESYVTDGYYDYDLEKAKAAYAKAKLPKGTTLTIINNGSANDAAQAQIIQASLASIGIDAKIVTYDAAVYFPTMMDPTKGWDIALQGITCPSGLGADLVNAWMMHLGITGYKDPAFVAAINDAITKSEIEDMAGPTKIIYDILVRDLPYFTFTQMAANYAYSNKVKDFVIWNQSGLKLSLYSIEE